MDSTLNMSVREIKPEDVPLILQYWYDADDAYLLGMGVDLNKMPAKTEFEAMLQEQLAQTYDQKKAYALIWLLDDVPLGHCNVNKIIFSKEAYMHLHLWKPDKRKKGMGTEYVKLSLPWFFNQLQLQEIFCEPYALNPAPNKVLEKTGFEFEKQYLTIPGSLNSEQMVKRWRMTRDNYEKNLGGIRIKD